MAEQTAEQVRMIVIPRELEGFFYERLSERYRDRPDVKVIVDRRLRERRRSVPYQAGPAPLTNRRRADRRTQGPRWSLAEMPFSTS